MSVGSNEASAPSASTGGQFTASAITTHERYGRLPRKLGRYELLLPLAAGGMGLVYIGRLLGAHGFDRMLAIKVLSTEIEPKLREAFLKEGRLASRIAHANVVSTFDLGEQDGVPYIVMEFIQGPPLTRLLRTMAKHDRRTPPGIAAWMIQQTARGLHAAHELTDDEGNVLGLVHRDVSPHNVLLSFDGRVHVTDFGVAKLSNSEAATTDGSIKGKFAYMAPEQVHGKPLDRRADVFALGILLYETLTGYRLFKGDTPAETVMRVVEYIPESPSQLVDGVPEAYSEVALKCLQKKPEDRYESAAEVADALRAALRSTGEGVDETDLAKLLGEYFAESRAEMEAQLRAAKELTTNATVDVAAIGPGEQTGSKVVLTSESRTARRKAITWGGGAVAALLAIIVATLGIRALLAPPEPDAPPAAAAAPVDTATAEPEPAPEPSASLEPADSASPPPSAQPDPKPVTQPAVRRTAPRPVAPAVKARPKPKTSDPMFDNL